MTQRRFWGGAFAFCLVAILTGTPGGARAGVDDPDPDCNDPVAQQEMNLCSAREYEAADAQLNTVYRAVMAAQDTQGKATLRASEREWIVQRDRTCKEETAGEEGGSIYPLEYNTCMIRLTKERTRELHTKFRH